MADNAKEANETAGLSVIVDDIFLSHLKVRRKELNRLFEVSKDLAEEWAKDYYLSRAVPEIDIMEKIFRYEKAARRTSNELTPASPIYRRGGRIDANGNRYGTASGGGNLADCFRQGCGVVWEITP